MALLDGNVAEDAQLDHFGYLLQPGSEEPVEYIPVDDFFDQVLAE